MAWLLVVTILGLLLGMQFRFPAVVVATALLIAAGLLADRSWSSILAGMAALQGGYFAGLVLSSARARWSRSNRPPS